MMVKITERCTMGCTHCMNDAKPDGRDMSLDTLRDTLDFFRKNSIGRSFILTGGEPLEHANFESVIDAICQWNDQNDRHLMLVTVTTNGEKIAENWRPYVAYREKCTENGISLIYQVSADVRYYPRRIATHKKIFRTDGFVLCDNCVESMYPMGRARTNGLDWQSKCSKCFNVRAISKQISGCTLNNIETELMMHRKFCTPHIAINGDIKLGESDLCPKCASIYDDEKTIIGKIRAFQCHGCDMINDRLPDMYRKFIQ